MESDTHLLYFTKLSGKSQDFYFLVGIHLNAKDPKGFTPLHATNQHFSNTVYTPCEMCVFCRELLQVIKLLLDKGADINDSSLNGIAALHNATRNGLDEIVQELINRGANIDATDKRGDTPLHPWLMKTAAKQWKCSEQRSISGITQ